MPSLPEGNADALYATCVAVVAEFKGAARSTTEQRDGWPPLPVDWPLPQDTLDRVLAECAVWLDLTEIESVSIGGRSDALLHVAQALCTTHDDVTALNIMTGHPTLWAVALDKRNGSKKRARAFLWGESIRAARKKVGPPFEDLGPGEEPAAGQALDLPDLDIGTLSAARFIDTVPPVQIFNGPIPHPTTGVVYGPGGAGKSFLMQAMLTGFATAVDVLGVPEWVPTSPVPVLMLTAEESNADLHRRQYALVRAAEQIGGDLFGGRTEIGPLLRERLHEGRFTVASTQGMRIELVNERGRRKGADWLLRQLDRGHHEIVTVDPVAAFRTGPEDELQPLIDLGREINEKLGKTLVYLHHTNKSSRGSDQAREATAARGDSAFIDGGRFGIGVAGMSVEEAARLKVEDRRNYVGVRLAKANYTEESDIFWFARGPAGVLYATSFKPLAEQRADLRGGQRDAVLKLVLELEEREMQVSKSELVARIMDRKLATRDAARAIVGDLLAENVLRIEYGDPGDTERRCLPYGWILSGCMS